MRDVLSQNLHSVWGNNKQIDNIISKSHYCYKESKAVQCDRVTRTGMTIAEGGENRKPLFEEIIDIQPKSWVRRFEAEYSREMEAQIQNPSEWKVLRDSEYRKMAREGA